MGLDAARRLAELSHYIPEAQHLSGTTVADAVVWLLAEGYRVAPELSRMFHCVHHRAKAGNFQRFLSHGQLSVLVAVHRAWLADGPDERTTFRELSRRPDPLAPEIPKYWLDET